MPKRKPPKDATPDPRKLQEKIHACICNGKLRKKGIIGECYIGSGILPKIKLTLRYKPLPTVIAGFDRRDFTSITPGMVDQAKAQMQKLLTKFGARVYEAYAENNFIVITVLPYRMKIQEPNESEVTSA
jgi:hypothetical protein